jgi:hypothetical protein
MATARRQRMNILDVLMSSAGQSSIEQLGKSFGLPQGSTKDVVGQVVPVLTRALGKNAASGGGLDGLIGALSSGNHGQYLEQPASVAQPGAIEDGKRILGHVLGSKDASRALAQQAASKTGVDVALIKQLLPAIAAMTMGALSKQTAGGQQLKADGGLGPLAKLFDMDGDGQVLDDVMGLAKKFF